MNELKIESWNGHNIRFVSVDDEWFAVAKDVATALGYSQTQAMTKHLDKDDLMSSKLDGMNMKSTLISEMGIYEAVFNSRREEAKEFKTWVKQLIKSLREKSGLEGFAVFRMMDKEHQKLAMEKISQLKEPNPKHFIKANTVANKVTSTIHGYPKMVKKGDMTPEMLKARQSILEDTVELMRVKDEYNLDISVSDSVKSKWVQ